MFHRDEVTPVRVALKTVKTVSTPMEGGLPGNITDEIAISPQSKQPYQPSETPRPSKYPLNPEAPEYRHTKTPNQEGSPHDVKISGDQDTSFIRLMETQDQHNQALMELVRHQKQSTAALTLPQPSMQVFSGDPIDYCDFIHAFEHLIEQKTTSSSSRLYYLVQYTSGPAQELMRSCLSMREEESYVEARRLLKERYGRSYKIAATHVKRLIDGPSIKPEDGSALEQFSIQLSSCVNTLKEIGYVNKLDNPDNLKKIINLLPFGIRLKWRDAVDRIIENENQDVTVKDIMDFVAAKARAATHPIFGKVLNENKGKQVNGKSLRKPLRGGGFSRLQAHRHPLKLQRKNPSVPPVLLATGCHAATSFANSLSRKGNGSWTTINSAVTALQLVTSCVTAQGKASAGYKGVSVNTLLSYIQEATQTPQALQP